jgi:hypothetical protein
LKLIPDVLFDTKSPAERRVFDRLTKLDLGIDWTGYHSLNLSEHEYKAWSTIAPSRAVRVRYHPTLVFRVENDRREVEGER